MHSARTKTFKSPTFMIKASSKKKHTIVDCLEHALARQHCGAKRNRPKTEKRKCNNFACASSWVSGEWEDCNSSCGKLGIQTR